MVRAEKFLGPINSELLDDIHILTAAVPSFLWIALRVFVRQYRALRFHDRGAGEILARDQLDIFLLALNLMIDGLCDFRVHRSQRVVSWHDSGFHFIDSSFVAASLKARAQKGVDNYCGFVWRRRFRGK